MKEVNAPAAAAATILASIGTLINYLPTLFGCVSMFFGSLLSYQLWKHKRLESKAKTLEIELLERKLNSGE